MFLLSRTRTVAKASSRLLFGVAHQTTRNASGGWEYRTTQRKFTRSEEITLNSMSFVFFSWVLYRIYHDFLHHIVPPKDYPDASNYTDAELGIPPDDAELAIPPADAELDEE